MLIFSRKVGEEKFLSAKPVMPRIIGRCSSFSDLSTSSPGDAVGVEGRTHGQVVGDGPEPEAPGDGRVLPDGAEVDAVLAGDGRRRR